MCSQFNLFCPGKLIIKGPIFDHSPKVVCVSHGWHELEIRYGLLCCGWLPVEEPTIFWAILELKLQLRHVLNLLPHNSCPCCDTCEVRKLRPVYFLSVGCSVHPIATHTTAWLTERLGRKSVVSEVAFLPSQLDDVSLCIGAYRSALAQSVA